jgi:hypothetical protein
VNYGPFDNYTYLFRFGFVPSGNPYSLYYCYPEHVEDYDMVVNTFRVAD